jgi:hypothetical protein
VQAAYKSFRKARRRARKNGRKTPIDSTMGQEFTLFSSEYLNRYTSEFGDTPVSTERVNFYLVEDEDEGISRNDRKQVVWKEKPMYVSGDMYFDSETNCLFSLFRLSTYARRKDVNSRALTTIAAYA